MINERMRHLAGITLNESAISVKVKDEQDFFIDVVRAGNIGESLWGAVIFGPGYLKVEDEMGKKYTIKGSAYQKLAKKYGKGKPFKPDTDDISMAPYNMVALEGNKEFKADIV